MGTHIPLYLVNYIRSSNWLPIKIIVAASMTCMASGSPWAHESWWFTMVWLLNDHTFTVSPFRIASGDLPYVYQRLNLPYVSPCWGFTIQNSLWWVTHTSVVSIPHRPSMMNFPPFPSQPIYCLTSTWSHCWSSLPLYYSIIVSTPDE